MNILAVDTTTKCASVSVKTENSLYIEKVENEFTHSEKLLPLPKNLYELNITLLPFCLYSLFFTYILHF